MLLTKSRYVAWQRCDKRAWLSVNAPELANCGQPSDPADPNRVRLKEGIEVGRFARAYFGDYALVPHSPDHAESPDYTKMVEKTAALMEEGGPDVIAEAVFQGEGNFCVVDLLRRGEDGWAIVEVKSSTAKFKKTGERIPPSPKYLEDLGFQNFVLTKVGVSVTSAELMELDGTFKREGNLDPKGLFTVVDLTEEIRAEMPHVEAKVVALHKAVAQTSAPDIPIGSRCNKPFECPFKAYCWRDVPKFSVFNVFPITKAAEKYHAGVRDLDDIRQACAADPNYLTGLQTLIVEDEANPDLPPIVDHDALDQFLGQVRYPLAHLDFESYAAPLPRWDGLGPYDPVVFQYSLHLQESPGSLTRHKEFLAPEGVDPRCLVAKTLVEDLAEVTGSIVVWNRSFEAPRIEEMKTYCPEFEAELDDIKNRIVDLAVPFKNRTYYDYGFRRKWSIKKVLPALFPSDPALDHENLDLVHDGRDASDHFKYLHLVEDPEERGRVREALLRYCELDTLATARILDFLREVQENPKA